MFTAIWATPPERLTALCAVRRTLNVAPDPRDTVV